MLNSPTFIATNRMFATNLRWCVFDDVETATWKSPTSQEFNLNEVMLETDGPIKLDIPAIIDKDIVDCDIYIDPVDGVITMRQILSSISRIYHAPLSKEMLNQIGNPSPVHRTEVTWGTPKKKKVKTEISLIDLVDTDFEIYYQGLTWHEEDQVLEVVLGYD